MSIEHVHKIRVCLKYIKGKRRTLGMRPEKISYLLKLLVISIPLVFCFMGEAMAYEEPEYLLV